MQVAPGKTMIRVAGIFYIVFGALGILAGIFFFLFGNALAQLIANASVNTSAEAVLSSDLAKIGMVILGLCGVILGTLEVVLGIVGIRASDDPYRGRTVIRIGYVLAALQILSFILNVAVTFGEGGRAENLLSAVIGLIIGLILPALFIIGGRKNLNVLR
ncbi:MAG: hypothetical protein LBU07_00880 [Coriobacteriales bacterium]|jgi:hypothetical protein|nr:hypothetical protein [Coriobacteriales bacterium]